MQVGTSTFSVLVGNREQGGIIYAVTADDAVIPEPSSLLAMLSGLVGLVGYGIRRRK